MSYDFDAQAKASQAEAAARAAVRRVSELEAQAYQDRIANSYRNMPPPVYTSEASWLDKLVIWGGVVCLVTLLIGAASQSREGQYLYWELKSLVQTKLGYGTTSDVTPDSGYAFYRGMWPDANGLAGTPASTLYVNYLKGASPEWGSLSPRQRTALQGAWLRYQINPNGFRQLTKVQRAFYRKSFESMLTELERQGVARAGQDRLGLGKLG